MEADSNQPKKQIYDNTTVVVILCIFFPPVGLIFLWLNRGISKPIKILVTAVIGVIILSAIINNKRKSSSSDNISSDDTVEEVEEVEEKTPEEIEEDFKKQLQIELESEAFKTGVLDLSGVDDLEGMVFKVTLLKAWSGLINEAETYENEEIKSMASQLKQNVITLQVQSLPKMRQKVGEILARDLWEGDVIVTTTNYDHSVINFTGRDFALNKNIKKTQETFLSLFQSLRFKQSTYRWNKIASEYTYYDMEYPADNELYK